MIKKICALPLLSILAFTAACDSNSTNKNRITISNVKGGFFVGTQAGAAYANFSGQAQLMVTDKSSSVEVYVNGLTPSAEYNAHVHVAKCESGGGGHYLQDGNPENDVAENGLWPTITVDENGVGKGWASNDFVVTSDAKSVVIHETGGSDRIACVDLNSSQGLSGTFSISDAGKALYENIEGSAFVSVDDSWTSRAEVDVMGLTPETTYKAHVHVGDCASGGAGHYLQDGDTENDVITNGLWPTISVNEFTYGVGWASNPFMLRLDDAKSVVIHDALDPSIRIACSDLSASLLGFRSGGFNATLDGEALYGAIQGRAKLSISADSESTVSVYASGLLADTEYNAHVHNDRCESGGGGHYLHDMNTENDVAENGLFPFFTTGVDGTGVGTASNPFIVRQDARSVVIHEAGTSTRIACADLL